jgi:hypothetical protein
LLDLMEVWMQGFVALGRIAVLAGAVLATGAVQGQAQVFEYHELCEASAAVAVGRDHFLVAEDESSTLRLYKRGTPVPVLRADFSGALGVKEKTKTDIEGAAAIGSRVYWITSHGQHSSGDDRPQRMRFFATDIIGEGAQATVKLVGKPYTGLREDLLNDKALDELELGKAAKLPPEAEHGFNIEGLAATPEGMLLIGFRNPVRNGRALVVPLENPDAVVIDGKRAKFGEPRRPDLEGFGIRSLERVNGSYLIVAGPFDNGSVFSLRRWSGAKKEKPVVLPQPALSGLAPEVVFAIPGTDTVQILSDDGEFWKKAHGDKECNDFPPEQRRFRSIVVKP